MTLGIAVPLSLFNKMRASRIRTNPASTQSYVSLSNLEMDDRVSAFFEQFYGVDARRLLRRYPNEELLRFFGRNFLDMPFERRRTTRVLEVGCGSGANLWMIAREGFDAFGIDFSRDALALCEQTLSEWGYPASLSVADMTATHLPDQYFDVIIDVFSSYALDESHFCCFVKEVARLLKPGGIFFCYTPAKTSDAYRSHAPSRLIDASTLDGIRREDSPYSGNLYPFRFSTGEELCSCFSAHGLQRAYCETVGRTYRGMQERFEFVVTEAVRQ